LTVLLTPNQKFPAIQRNHLPGMLAVNHFQFRRNHKNGAPKE